MRADELDPGRPPVRSSIRRRSPEPARPSADGGQSTVELALVLPVLLVLVLGIVQVGLVVRDHVRVVHAAREGARAAAVSSDPAAAEQAVAANAGLAPDRLRVVTSGRGARGSAVTVSVTYRASTDLPLVGPLLPDLELDAAATMRVER